ncbi:MAG: (d)CMP kinase [bacterium]
MGLEMLNIVTIDGPAASGKSTVAGLVAEKLGYAFLDTGAMYRAIAFGALENGIPAEESGGLHAYLEDADLEIHYQNKVMHLVLNGRDITQLIRHKDMGQHASDYSKLHSVRVFCTDLQRRLGQSGKLVCEGRDMGTVVFPGARWKFFLTASLEERAIRRWRELKTKGENISLEEIKNSLMLRDLQDSNRALAPLKPADDAHIIDTTEMQIDGVVEKIVEVVFESIEKKS